MGDNSDYYLKEILKELQQLRRDLKEMSRDVDRVPYIESQIKELKRIMEIKGWK